VEQQENLIEVRSPSINFHSGCKPCLVNQILILKRITPYCECELSFSRSLVLALRARTCACVFPWPRKSACSAGYVPLDFFYNQLKRYNVENFVENLILILLLSCFFQSLQSKENSPAKESSFLVSLLFSEKGQLKWLANCLL